MRIGCCGAIVVGRKPEEAGRVITGIEALDAIERLGFDYIEMSLSDIMDLSEQGFADQAGRLARSSLACEVLNNFVPPSIRLTGPDADQAAAMDYARRAFTRAERVGAGIVVFGSSGARNVPPGFPVDDAREQLAALLAKMGEAARAHGLVVAIEHLNRRESNIINSLPEALALARCVGHANVRVLCDYYHLMTEHEDWGAIAEAGAAIVHVHLAEPEGRGFPRAPSERYREFFGRLKEAGYTGRVSVEAFTKDFEADGAAALRVLRGLIAGPPP